MIVAAILPFILILLIMGVIYFLVNGLKKFLLFQKINVKWVLSAYGGILVISLLLFYVLPLDASSTNMVNDEEELEQAGTESHKLLTAALDGVKIREAKIEGVEVKKKWNFSYKGKKLEISVEEQSGPILTVVERKEVNDEKIEVSHFHTRTIIENIDMTNEISPFTLSLADDSLNVTYSEQVDFHLGKYNKEFIISQFTDENGIDSFSEQRNIWGENVIYLRVPKDLEISGEVQFVKD